jgi:hypothetical protein
MTHVASLSVEVDAFLGEVLTTCSKIDFLLAEGEKALRPEKRGAGNLLLAHKVSKVSLKAASEEHCGQKPWLLTFNAVTVGI